MIYFYKLILYCRCAVENSYIALYFIKLVEKFSISYVYIIIIYFKLLSEFEKYINIFTIK